MKMYGQSSITTKQLGALPWSERMHKLFSEQYKEMANQDAGTE